MRLNFSQNVRSALRALMANKLRSALTMLGIVIGVGAVVALLSIGTGAQAAITNQISGIGSNLITIFSGSRVDMTTMPCAPLRCTSAWRTASSSGTSVAR